MFKKLRNRLILINFGITTFVILIIFSTIYFISTKTAENRPLDMQRYSFEYTRPSDDFSNYDENNNNVPDDVEKMVLFSVREEKENAASSLLLTLVLSGIAIEIAVIIVSYYLADEAIKPIKEAYESQKIFIANASHEIKTPLAAIAANLEAADIQNNKWIRNVELETEKLTHLNSELLNLARTDIMGQTSNDEVDLKELTLKVLDRFEPRLNEKRLTKEIDVPQKVKISAADYEQILSILIDNAIKYSSKSISVTVNKHFLEVTNDGKTIGAEEISHVFDRFYQVDKSSEGVGLGLSIAKAVADRNGWKLTVKSKKKTSFLLYF